MKKILQRAVTFLFVSTLILQLSVKAEGILEYNPSVIAGTELSVNIADTIQSPTGLEDRVVRSEYTADKFTVDSNRHEIDFTRMLNGQVPGLNVIHTGGLTGSGTSLRIRGQNSFFGNNTPLIIVDGVRFEVRDDPVGSIRRGGALSAPNRLLDIDPAIISEISVLNNLSSTSVYGAEGRNGAILITTKNGNFSNQMAERGFDVSFTQSIYNTKISSRPDYQNQFGAGLEGFYGAAIGSWGPSFDETDPALFGSAYRGTDADGTVLLSHPLLNHPATAEAFPGLQDVDYRYEPKANPIDAFFRSGLGSSSHLNVAGGTDSIMLNVNYSRSAEDGFTPNNSFTRDAFGIGSAYSITENLRSVTTFNLSSISVSMPMVSQGAVPNFFFGNSGDSVFRHLFYTPRSIDLNMPHQHPSTGGPVFYRAVNDITHPQWVVENSLNDNNSERYFGKTELEFSVSESVNIRYRIGYDSFTERQEFRLNPGNLMTISSSGIYQTSQRSYKSWNHLVQADYSIQLSETLSLSGFAGGDYREEKVERTGLSSENIIVSNLFTHTNFLNQTVSDRLSLGANDLQATSEMQISGLFTGVTLNVDEFLFLNFTGRNDWFSTLQPGNRTVFNPAASISYLASEHLNFGGEILSSLRLFGGFGTTARSPEPYKTGMGTVGINLRSFINSNGNIIQTGSISTVGGGTNLKPERQKELNTGVDLQFFNGRAGLQAVLYNRTVSDLIVGVPTDPSTGFTLTNSNIGEMTMSGLELSLNAAPLNRSLHWDIRAVYFSSDSEVLSLNEKVEGLIISSGASMVQSAIIPGEPFGVLYGSRIFRVTEELQQSNPAFSDVEIGTPVLNTLGFFQVDDEPGVIGDPNPDWNLSLLNDFRFRGITLSIQIDYQHGGDMYSEWVSQLTRHGAVGSTTNRNAPFVRSGVTMNGEMQTIMMDPQSYYSSLHSFGPDELRVVDLTHIRLSHIGLSWDMPLQIIEHTPFSGLQVSVSASNLWLYMFNLSNEFGFEPNVNTFGTDNNAFGYENLTGPGARRFGGSIRVLF